MQDDDPSDDKRGRNKSPCHNSYPPLRLGPMRQGNGTEKFHESTKLIILTTEGIDTTYCLEHMLSIFMIK